MTLATQATNRKCRIIAIFAIAIAIAILAISWKPGLRLLAKLKGRLKVSNHNYEKSKIQTASLTYKLGKRLCWL